MDREMIVLVDDLKGKESYGFMATPTPAQYVKKAKWQFDVNDDAFVFKNDENESFDIKYDDIQKVVLSLCTRIVSSAGFGGGLRTTAHIDMDIQLKNGDVYLYEVVRPDTFEKVFITLHKQHIEIQDIIGIEDIYKRIEGAGTRNKYITGNFGKFKRKYKLDHPRRT